MVSVKLHNIQIKTIQYIEDAVAMFSGGTYIHCLSVIIYGVFFIKCLVQRIMVSFRQSNFTWNIFNNLDDDVQTTQEGITIN